jgi:hypothetical protein
VVQNCFRDFKPHAKTLQAGGDGAAQIMDALWHKRCGVVPGAAAALARRSIIAVSKARFAWEQSPKGVPTAPGRASVPARGCRRGRRRNIKNLKVSRSASSANTERRDAEAKIKRDGVWYLAGALSFCGRKEPEKGCPRQAGRPGGFRRPIARILGLGAYRALTDLPINSLRH